MKFSVHLAQLYSDNDIISYPRDEILSRIGSQLGAVEDVVDWREAYLGIVVARIVAVEKHPNADKLSICTIDDAGITPNVNRDENGHVVVVCGARNVAVDMFVAWIPPGATVPNTFHTEPFILEARELRGVVSNGMIASPKELAMGDDHNGILEITADNAGREPIAGDSISSYYGLDDFVIDCENKMFTHRPDCFGNLGIAREVVAIMGDTFKSPRWYTETPVFEQKYDLALETSNTIETLVPRFMTVVMRDVVVAPSQLWVQTQLQRVGIKPINNVVDMTNYIMHVTGQPLHAYDYDKLLQCSHNPSLLTRQAMNGETLTLLGGKTIELHENDMVIATDKQVVGLAGIMGGADTEVDASTTRIVIECASFDMYAIRRTSMRHGLFTDAATRFNKGQSPLQNDKVLAFAMNLMSEHCGAVQASSVSDHSSSVVSDSLHRVETTSHFINERLGSQLNAEDMKNLLDRAELETSLDGDTLNVVVPFWRMDIAIAEDIVEEVGRLYGYDRLDTVLPKRSTRPTPKNELRQFKQSMRSMLSSAGLNEVLTYSFVKGDLLRQSGTDPDKWAFHLRNAISPDLQYYRTTLVTSLLQKVRANLKAQAGSDNNVFGLYEIGKAHVKGEMEEPPQGDLPKEIHRLAMVFAADDKTATHYKGAPYYQARKYLDLITNYQAVYTPLETNDYPITSAYQIGRSATVSLNGQLFGVIGEFNQSLQKALKLPTYCAGFEVDVELLHTNLQTKKYTPQSQYPNSSQDMTFEVDAKVDWALVANMVEAELAVAAAENDFNVTCINLGVFQPEDSSKKRISFRVEVSHHKKTLKTEEVSQLVSVITEALDEKLQARRV